MRPRAASKNDTQKINIMNELSEITTSSVAQLVKRLGPLTQALRVRIPPQEPILFFSMTSFFSIFFKGLLGLTWSLLEKMVPNIVISSECAI